MFSKLKSDFDKLRRIPFKLDKSFYLLLLILPFANYLFGGAIMGVSTLLFLPTIFMFALIHEYSHCWAAQHYGFEVAEVKLWFLGGLATIVGMNTASPKEEAVIAFAGPLSNFVIAGVFTVFHFVFGINAFILYVITINMVLGLFNMIPAFPMDGGRLLRSGLHQLLGDKLRATRISAHVGIGISAFFIVLGLLSANFMIILIFGWVGMLCFSILQNEDMIV
jgi:Zn-dependent protease